MICGKRGDEDEAGTLGGKRDRLNLDSGGNGPGYPALSANQIDVVPVGLPNVRIIGSDSLTGMRRICVFNSSNANRLPHGLAEATGNGETAMASKGVFVGLATVDVVYSLNEFPSENSKVLRNPRRYIRNDIGLKLLSSRLQRSHQNPAGTAGQENGWRRAVV